MNRIHYDRYIVCEGHYPFRRLGTMNKVEGEDDAKHVEAARRRFAEPHPVLIDTALEALQERNFLDHVYSG